MRRTLLGLTVAAVALAAGAATGQVSGPQHRPAPAEDPQRALDRLDSRRPLPLLPMMAHHQKANMRDHLEAVQAIVAALARNDFAAVEQAAKRIGTSPAMTQMCNHMGAGAPGFTELALGFHRQADGIGEAAWRQDGPAVLAALDATLATCTGCHATYRQQVVDEAEWSRLTGTSAPHGPAGHGAGGPGPAGHGR